MKSEADFEIEIVYARPDRQAVIRLCVPRGTTAAEAIGQSGVAARFPEIGSGPLQVGVFGRRVDLETELVPGDRLEIYRPLLADPKQARRRRAKNPQ